MNKANLRKLAGQVRDKKTGKTPDIISPIKEDFVDWVFDGLRLLFPGLVCEGKNDGRNGELQYYLPHNEENSDIPGIIKEIVDHGKKNYQLPPNADFSVLVGIYMRKSRMVVSPPTPLVACRLVFNYHQDEVYTLDPRIDDPSSKNSAGKIMRSIDTGLPRRELYVPKNSILTLGPASVCNYKVVIGPNPQVKVPSQTPDIPGVRGLSQRRGPMIRPARYERITIILDCIASEEEAQKLTNILRGEESIPEINRLNMNDQISEDTSRDAEVDDIMTQLKNKRKK